jgi:hypothetical protein
MDYESIEDFVAEIRDDERTTYTHDELGDLAFCLRRSRGALRKELEAHGLTLAERPVEKRVRGFTTSSHDRYWGNGSSPMHGGSGGAQINGFATYDGYGSQKKGTDFGGGGGQKCGCH